MPPGRDVGWPRRSVPTLAGTSRLFLRGEAGSGKTTLLQWLAVRAARQDFPERLSRWNDLVPFLIRLRRGVGRGLPTPEEFVNEIGRHIAADMPHGWVHRLLGEGRALLLIDGVDELPEPQRRPAREWLAALIDTFPNARYVITSRPGAAASTWLDAQGFDAAEIQPMGWPDVLEFVRHWHAAFRADSTDADHLARLADSEAAMLEALSARRHLRLLATSPLLCALLCALNLDRRAQLPDERMELYAIALDMLLERRDAERQITAATWPQLSKTAKTLLLEDLAYWLIRSGWSDAPRDRVTERFARRLATGLAGEVTAAVARLLPRRARMQVYWAANWPGLCDPVAPAVLAEPFRSAATAWSRAWVSGQVADHAAAGRSWAQADAHDAFFPHDPIPPASPMPEASPFLHEAFLPVALALPLADRYDPALPSPYLRCKSPVVSLLPRESAGVLPQRKQYFSRALTRQADSGRRAPRCVAAGLLDPQALSAEHDPAVLLVVAAVERWLVGAQ